MAKKTTAGDLMRRLAKDVDLQRELDRLYLDKKAKAFRMFRPDNPEQIIMILLRVARRRDPAYRKTAEEMMRKGGRPKGSRNRAGHRRKGR